MDCDEAWECSSCTFVNQSEARYCEACYTLNESETGLFSPFFPDGEAWECTSCTFINQSGTRYCEACYRSKESSTFGDTTEFDSDYSGSHDVCSKNECPSCTYDNLPWAEVCEACDSVLGLSGNSIEDETGAADGGERTWTCPQSSKVNELDSFAGEFSGMITMGPDTENDVEREKGDFQEQSARRNTLLDWTCSECTVINESWSNFCTTCNKARYAEIGPPPLFEEVHMVRGAVGGNWEDAALQHADDFMDSEFGENSILNQEIRIVLIGRTGSGKSATGNSILGTENFHSMVGGSSVTRQCKRGRAKRMGKHIQVIDSPGLFDTGMTNAQITKEIVKCIGMTSPGPHAIILVTRIDRFTKEEQDTVEHFRQVFGEGMMDYLIILFTRKDDLDAHGTSVDSYVQNVPPELKSLIQESNRRYIAFNNRAPPDDRDRQVQQLFSLIDGMIRGNGNHYYTNDMYREAERNMRRREVEIKKKLEKEKQRQRKQIEQEFYERHEIESLQQQEIIGQLQDRVLHLQNEKHKAKFEEGKRLTGEIRDLKATVARMEHESERAQRKDRMEYERKLKTLEEEVKQINYQARERARNEVEKEESSFGMVWNGLKSVGKGVFNFFKSLF